MVAGGCSLDAKGILEDNVCKKYFSGVRRRSQFITRSSASGVEGRPDGEHEREMKIHLDRIVFSSQAPWKLTDVEVKLGRTLLTHLSCPVELASSVPFLDGGNSVTSSFTQSRMEFIHLTNIDWTFT